jgi:hypothetical protein
MRMQFDQIKHKVPQMPVAGFAFQLAIQELPAARAVPTELAVPLQSKGGSDDCDGEPAAKRAVSTASTTRDNGISPRTHVNSPS